MKALVVAPQPFFTPRGTPLSVYHRTRVMASLGVEVDFLTYGEGRDVRVPGVRIIRIPRIRMLEPVRVGPSFGKLVLDTFMVAWTVALLARRRYDFVHAHEEAVFWCSFLEPAFGFKLVYDMHSSLPQQLTNFGFTRSRLLIGTFEWLERLALRMASAVITISPALAEYAESHPGVAERHLLIENSLFEPVRFEAGEGGEAGADEVTVELPPEAPVVGYAGTFESYQGIDLLLRAHALVRRVLPEAVLLLVGGSPDKVAEYRQLARSLGVSDACRFTGTVSQEEARALMRRASVLVSPRIRGTNTPLKIYEILAGDRPLVATRIASHTQVLTEDACILADPEPEAFAAGVLEALQDASRRREVVAGARRLYETAYAPERYQAKMRRLLDLLH
ncbi:MAG: glycosyltransferase family 4 protein [Gemmatimonadota bacterium]